MKQAVAGPVGRIVIDFERCKACELCIPACPRHCIEAGSRINRHGFASVVFARPGDCTGCGLCAESCPDVCIQVWR